MQEDIDNSELLLLLYYPLPVYLPIRVQMIIVPWRTQLENTSLTLDNNCEEEGGEVV